MKIFYIEDNPTNLFLVKNLLEKENIKFRSSDTGEKGLESIKEFKPDLVLIDINLPGLSGYEITKEIRRDPDLKDITIIAISANNSEEDKEIAKAIGCNAYIEKPINPKTFYEQLIYFHENKDSEVNSTDKEYYLDKYTDKLIDSLKNKIAELERTNQMLEKTNKMKSDFIAVASHELKTPIVPITGYLDILLKEKHGKLNLEQKNILNKVSDSADRLSNIINKIIDMARLEKGFVKLNKRNINIGKLVDRVIDNLKLYTEKRNIIIKTNIKLNNYIISCDEEKIEFVLYNILNNAIKFSKDNSFIELMIENKNTKTFFYIKDNGVGLEKEEIDLVFDKFFSGLDIAYHHTSNYEFQGKGIGLGLSIAKDFIEMHNGKIYVESEGKDKGTTFYFFI